MPGDFYYLQEKFHMLQRGVILLQYDPSKTWDLSGGHEVWELLKFPFFKTIVYYFNRKR